MRRRRGVTLQINLAPTDLPVALHVLPHQLRQWSGQVDEVLLIMDLHRSRGRYGEAWSQRLPGMRTLIEESCALIPAARTEDVDYAPVAMASVAQQFFGGQPVPAKDRQGAAFYAYLFGLQRASHDVVLHMDSDMLYGGGSQAWIEDAIALMEADDHVLACNPLPGPPTADGTLRSQELVPYGYATPAFLAPAISTRHFLIDRRRFWDRVGRLRLSRPSPRNYLKAVIDGYPAYNPLEVNLSEAMAAQHGIRVDFLGSGPGMWAIHPLYRTPEFFNRLPTLVADIEAGRIPEGQRGHHDVTESMVDGAGTEATVTQKVVNHLRIAAGRFRSGRPRNVLD